MRWPLWTAVLSLFVVVGLNYQLQLYADGSIFSYAVAVRDAKHVVDLDGERHYFCAASCKAAFAADPARYAA